MELHDSDALFAKKHIHKVTQFKSTSVYTTQILSCHFPNPIDNSGRFVCPKCSASYKHKFHLVSHIRHECGVEPKFRCHICSVMFKYKRSLNLHLRLKHFQM
ncbi:hypothetical protein ILUMI_21719 [Ignelater luminosus]|uniref:C2H2-type domain-containing protein n=1 Tax=Ignelater luminosus TaxID=2038154 RepID=A0A8K0CBX9_IGNLU|nr:hypothetical protein ILUMI_21719 [Ignelater luminosus]